ncbi:hypothetical protein OG594_09035 [Streptomyces sp. NBC_01214]|uniref:hypothetical protein n=1 Tax=Streptomyces sp. NBC_01214 TaxID=2903777 RepID=UPI00225B950A|nr:hypothetical protein [Streptomyces sp. NBC_01214]MCX4801794.1 hypothetical protein [Streptomyces sp. NBC_01214]
MATDSYGQGFQVAALTDPPNAQTLATNLALMAGQTVMRFTNAAARAAAITSPVAGMHAYLVTEKRLTYYDGTAWIIQNTNAFVYASAVQSVLHNTATVININAAIVDDTAGLNVGGHYWLTPMAGVYRMTAMVSWVGSGGGGWRTLWLTSNGTQIVGSQGGSVGSTVGTTQERTCVATLAAGRQISLVALQQSGGALSTDLPGNVAGSIEFEFLHA